jgi:protocatechuate 3,4-dioxygenase beta subunit
MFQLKTNLLLLTCFAFSHSAISQDAAVDLKNTEIRLSSGEATTSTVLSDPSLMYLHPMKDFRELIKKNAKAERITIISPSEQGKKITVIGMLKDTSGKPVQGALVYFYQTSAKGWYLEDAPHSTEAEGDLNHARLFGYVKTSPSGKFEIETIQPQGYPKSDLPGHIHIQFFINGKLLKITTNELQFADDPRMTPERRKKSESERNLVSANTGNTIRPVYYYQMTLSK